jgi:hypothetical protein
VGDLVGAIVGDLVGTIVGDLVGTIVGGLVGTLVGDLVGAVITGLGVGDGVALQHKFLMVGSKAAQFDANHAPI